MLRLGALTLLLGLLTGTQYASAADLPVLIDPELPVYRPANSLTGELNLAGSNTMSHVAATWADGFRQFYPDVTIKIDVTGSRQAVSTVQDGKAHIGLLSRTIRSDEVTRFEKAKGHYPQVLAPCLERVAIYVHKDNPIRGLTLQQIDGIFSEACKRGCPEAIRNWGQLGFPGAWADQPVIARGRRIDTGSQLYFQEAVLLGGDFRSDLQPHPDNLELLRGITEDPRSVGFAGLCYDSHDVRAVPVAVQSGAPYIGVDSPEADAGLYPLVRPLQLVIDHDPQKPLPTVEAEFLKYVFSRLGQEDVIKAGFQPIPARPANIALDSVGLGIAR